MTQTLEQTVARHYAVPGLLEKIESGLGATGADAARPTTEALAPVDEFHTAGRSGTLKALAHMPFKRGMNVLDAGCGIGGTARMISQEHGCTVTGIDLTPEFIDVARKLTARMVLSDACKFEVGSVTDLPFDDNSFDAAVTFHVAMNIEDRPKFYSELRRVLRPGASLCVFDVMHGPNLGLKFPMPWAATPESSFLKTRDETVALLEQAGFHVTAEENLREFANTYFEKAMAQVEKNGGPPPLGLHLLTGKTTQEKFANVIEAYKLHQTEPVVLVAKRN